MGRTKRNDAEYARIGANIRKALENNAFSPITQNEICEYANISRQTLRNYMDGKRAPSLEIALKIAEKTDANVIDFLTVNEKKRLIGSKMQTVREENSEFVSYLRTLGYDIDIVSKENTPGYFEPDDVITLFKVNYGSFYKTTKNRVAQIKRDLEKAKTNGDKEEAERLARLYARWANEIKYPITVLNQHQWRVMKEEVDAAVNKIVSRSMRSIEVNRYDLRNLVDKMNDVCDLLQSSDDEKAAKARKTLSEQLESFKESYSNL